MEPSPPSALPGAVPLNATERRILGVLIEKGLTTPEYYPLSLTALVAGCNQKNNRDPVTRLDADQVEAALKTLEPRGLVLSVIGDSGRVPRWRHELTRKLELSVVELAVLGELLLRGAQSEGDLRGRAARMRPIETLDALRELLAKLRSRHPPFVLRLSPEGSARGVRWTHAMASPEQLQKWLAEEPAAADAGGATESEEPVPASRPDAGSNDLAARVAALEAKVAQLEAALRLPRPE